VVRPVGLSFLWVGGGLHFRRKSAGNRGFLAWWPWAGKPAYNTKSLSSNGKTRGVLFRAVFFYQSLWAGPQPLRPFPRFPAASLSSFGVVYDFLSSIHALIDRFVTSNLSLFGDSPRGVYNLAGVIKKKRKANRPCW